MSGTAEVILSFLLFVPLLLLFIQAIRGFHDIILMKRYEHLESDEYQRIKWLKNIKKSAAKLERDTYAQEKKWMKEYKKNKRKEKNN